MSMNRRTFTFTSLSLLTMSSLGYAHNRTNLADHFIGRWSARREGSFILVDLHLTNTSEVAQIVLGHRGLRPAPQLSCSFKHNHEVIEVQPAALTAAEMQETRLRAGPRAKWTQLPPQRSQLVCTFRLSDDPRINAETPLFISAVVKMSGSEYIKLPVQRITLTHQS